MPAGKPPYNASERAALALWLLAESGRHGMTAVKLADRLNVTLRQTYYVLASVSRVAPVTNECGRWKLMDDDDGDPPVK